MLARMSTASTAKTLGLVIVSAQMSVMAVIAFWWIILDWGPTAPASLIGGLALMAAGLVLVFITGRHLGAALTPLPNPNGTGLVAHGAYSLARHPMYMAVLTMFIGIAALSGRFTVWAATALLLAMFLFKARLEEKYLIAEYPGYREYGQKTGRFLPRIGRFR